MTKIMIIVSRIIMIIMIAFVIFPLSFCEEEIFIIDDMENIDAWKGLPELGDPNSSIKLSKVDDGIKISYDLKMESSWVDMYRDIDFSKLPKMDKIIFNYTGSGAPNTLEFKLEYENGDNFMYERTRGTNISGWWNEPLGTYNIISPDWTSNECPKGTPVEFSKVRRVRFAVANHPSKDEKSPGEKPGEGHVIITEIYGIKKDNIILKYENIWAAMISGICFVIGYLIGKSKS